jgi:hypothetical protein
MGHTTSSPLGPKENPTHCPSSGEPLPVLIVANDLCAAEALTNESILKLVTAGMSEDASTGIHLE